MATKLSEYTTGTAPTNGTRVRQYPESRMPPAQRPQEALMREKYGCVSVKEEPNETRYALNGLGELVQVVT